MMRRDDPLRYLQNKRALMMCMPLVCVTVLKCLLFPSGITVSMLWSFRRSSGSILFLI